MQEVLYHKKRLNATCFLADSLAGMSGRADAGARTHTRSRPYAQRHRVSVYVQVSGQWADARQFRALPRVNSSQSLRPDAVSARWHHDSRLSGGVDCRSLERGATNHRKPAQPDPAHLQPDQKHAHRIRQPPPASEPRPLSSPVFIRVITPGWWAAQNPHARSQLARGTAGPHTSLNLDPSPILPEECTRHDHRCQTCRQTWRCTVTDCPQPSYRRQRCASCSPRQAFCYDGEEG